MARGVDRDDPDVGDIEMGAPDRMPRGERGERALCSAYPGPSGACCALVTWIVIVVALMLCAILIPLDWSTVRVGHIGLIKDRNTKVVESDGRVYQNGVHRTGVTKTFFIYSARYEPYSVVARPFTDVGDEFDVRVQVLLRINRGEAGLVYDQYKDAYRKQVGAIIESSAKAIRDTTRDDELFSPAEYVTRRTQIRELILDEIKKRLEPQGFDIFDEYFSYTVDLPGNVVNQSLRSVVEGMRERVIELQQDVDVYEAETGSQEGAIRANITAAITSAATRAAAERSRGVAEAAGIEGSAIGIGMGRFFEITNTTDSPDDKVKMVRWLQRQADSPLRRQ